MGGWGDQPQETYAEGSGQSFIVGAPLTFSSGKVVVISSVTSPSICGIALNKASGTTVNQYNPNILVTVPLQQVVFKVSCDETTTNDTAALGAYSPSNFNIGTNYRLLLD